MSLILARALVRTGDLQQASGVLGFAISEVRGKNLDQQLLAGLLCELSAVEQFTGEVDKASMLIEESWLIATKLGDDQLMLDVATHGIRLASLNPDPQIQVDPTYISRIITILEGTSRRTRIERAAVAEIVGYVPEIAFRFLQKLGLADPQDADHGDVLRMLVKWDQLRDTRWDQGTIAKWAGVELISSDAETNWNHFGEKRSTGELLSVAYSIFNDAGGDRRVLGIAAEFVRQTCNFHPNAEDISQNDSVLPSKTELAR